MAGLSEQFRDRAKQQRDASNVLLASAELATSITKQVAATVGQVNATLLDALADMMDYQAHQSANPAESQVSAVLKRNDAIRMAAARGDWNEFDRLVNGGTDAPVDAGNAGTNGISGSDGS